MSKTATIIDYKNEHLLKSAKLKTGSPNRVADAQLTIERDGARYSFGLEIDAGKYHSKMLQRAIEEYGASEKPILWVVFTKGRLQRIRQLCRDVVNIHPILFDSL